ncbi:MAG: fumarate hydratase [Faecalibacterium prausnitzii]
MSPRKLCSARWTFPNPDPYYADLEKELLAAINELGIGPQGFGGRIHLPRPRHRADAHPCGWLCRWP